MRRKRVIGEKERTHLRLALAETIVALRRRQAISQEQLARESGTARAYMSGLERGCHSPSIETVWKLLPALGVTMTEFWAEFERAFARLPRNRNRV
jgi:transcriptional regulator with XRE-family HTH domain